MPRTKSPRLPFRTVAAGAEGVNPSPGTRAHPVHWLLVSSQFT